MRGWEWELQRVGGAGYQQGPLDLVRQKVERDGAFGVEAEAR